MFNNRKARLTKDFFVSKLKTDTNNGSLAVSVSSEDNEPIEGAKVSIYYYIVRGIYREAATEREIVSHLTDENGNAPLIELPVIRTMGSPDETNDEYHMKVDAPGYYSVVVMNVQIFPVTITSYNVELTPAMEGETYTRFIIIPERSY